LRLLTAVHRAEPGEARTPIEQRFEARNQLARALSRTPHTLIVARSALVATRELLFCPKWENHGGDSLQEGIDRR